MAWNIGANDVANSMGPAYGSKALTLKQVIIIAGIFEFLGAVLVGSHVTDTIRKGIVDLDGLIAAGVTPDMFVYGMLAALLASGLWITLATIYRLPVSTTHSIVGSVAGFGLIVALTTASSGIGDIINIGKLLTIAASWIVSPVSGAIISFLIFIIIRNKILNQENPLQHAERLAPFIVGLVLTIISLSMVFKGLKNLNLDFNFPEALAISLVVGTIAGIITLFWVKRYKPKVKDEYQQVENFFKYIMILTACYIAFAHGANDVANAIGPLAAICDVVKSGEITAKVSVPLWILALGGLGIVIGLATWGYKVMETIGHKITEITPTRGFAATFGAATTVLICSKLGLPISTSHTLVGSVIGVGFARGVGAIDLGVVKNIIWSWILTIPVAAVLTIIIYNAIMFVV
ncbi:phosphate permease [Candidatus Altiarchaeales archaeon WOR_SM1_SCG]|nr:phosphate permease [Candidatus Altiarchaeales archaeon WOR_SM1_SCG]